MATIALLLLTEKPMEKPTLKPWPKDSKTANCTTPEEKPAPTPTPTVKSALQLFGMQEPKPVLDLALMPMLTALALMATVDNPMVRTPTPTLPLPEKPLLPP